jgi:hypothetical protein
MPTQKPPLAQRVAEHYSTLLSASRDLNNISDELGKYISELDSSLKKLNLGVAVWVHLKTIQNPGESWFENEELGYAKASGSWGICLRKVTGDENRPPWEEGEELWLFNDAPRRFRIEAIDHIPTLIEKLSTEAVKTTKEIRDRLEDVKAVADAVKSAANQTERPERRIKPDLPAAASIIRTRLLNALKSVGNEKAAQILSGAEWTLNGDRLTIKVPAAISEQTVAASVNTAALQLIQGEFERILVPTARITLVSGQDSKEEK